MAARLLREPLPFLGDTKVTKTARTAVYIDGFNLYHGIIEPSGHKWLDLKAMTASLLAPYNEITLVRYFTARINARPTNPDGPTRQDIYLQALEAHTPEIVITEGQFKTRHKEKWTVSNPSKRVKVWHTEEKGSDVNLAVHLVNDSWKNLFDVCIVISNDSDLAEALSIVRSQGKIVGLLTPAKRPTKELHQVANFHKRIRPHHLKHAQLPNPIPGTNIHKPPAWD